MIWYAAAFILGVVVGGMIVPWVYEQVTLYYLWRES